MDATLSLLGTIGTILLTCVALSVKITSALRQQEREMLAAIQAMRDEASTARARLYDRLEEMRREISDTYVRRDVHAVDQTRILHALDEQNRILSVTLTPPDPATTTTTTTARQRRR